VSRDAGDRPTLHTLVIIPTFNERENLPLILQRVHQACPRVHVLVVDDNSPDDTGQLPTSWRRPTPTGSTSCTAPSRTVWGAAYLGWIRLGAQPAVHHAR